MNAVLIAAGLALATCLSQTGADAQTVQARPDGSVALPPARDGVITPGPRPVDPHMPVLHPGVPTRTPVIHPPAPPASGGTVQPR